MRETGAGGWLARTRILLGDAAIGRLARARIYVFGLGAVGSYAVEGLARSGAGFFRLVDFDRVQASNLNRQLFALSSTLGLAKAAAAAMRVRDINPAVSVEPLAVFAHADTLPDLLAGGPDLIIDAVDSLAPKIEILAAADRLGVPVFSALGAATRRDAGRIRFGPLFEANGCPLGRLVKKRLRRRGVEGRRLWCVYSDEVRNAAAVREPDGPDEYRRGRTRDILGSMATLTGMFGLRLAHEAALWIAGGAE